MVPDEVMTLFEKFKRDVENLTGNSLLDRWILLEETPEGQEPDLGLLKSACLEAMLIQQFGFEWRSAVQARRAQRR